MYREREMIREENERERGNERVREMIREERESKLQEKYVSDSRNQK